MYYNDQKGERIRKIDRKRLSEEFILEEQKTTETAIERRKELACGSENECPSSSTQGCPEGVYDQYDDCDDQRDTEFEVKRSFVVNCESDREISFPQFSPRMSSERLRGQKRLFRPNIMVAIVECEAVARCSMDTAIKVVQIVANRIFGQNWLLPLSMDEEYI